MEICTECREFWTWISGQVFWSVYLLFIPSSHMQYLRIWLYFVWFLNLFCIFLWCVCVCMHTQECVYACGEGRGQSGFFLNCSLVFLLGDRALTEPGEQWFNKPSWQVSIRWPPVWPHSAWVAGSCLHVELLHGCSTSELGPQACTTGTHWLNHLPGQHDHVPREALYKDKLIE